MILGCIMKDLHTLEIKTRDLQKLSQPSRDRWHSRGSSFLCLQVNVFSDNSRHPVTFQMSSEGHQICSAREIRSSDQSYIWPTANITFIRMLLARLFCWCVLLPDLQCISLRNIQYAWTHHLVQGQDSIGVHIEFLRQCMSAKTIRSEDQL